MKGNNGSLNIYQSQSFPHELGHIMGLPDRYNDTMVNGKLKSVAFPGWEDNIMGNAEMNASQKDVNMIIDYNFNKNEINQCGCSK